MHGALDLILSILDLGLELRQLERPELFDHQRPLYFPRVAVPQAQAQTKPQQEGK